MNEHPIARNLRQFALLLCGFVTLITPMDLLLVGHTQKPAQWIPFVMLAINFAFVAAMLARPESGTLRVYRWFAGAMLLTGLVGVGFHLHGNYEMVQQFSPDLSGLSLLLEVLSGKNPALAPGLFAQIAALGLMFTFKHPNLEQAVYARQAVS
jgi:xanthine/uracil permease